MYERMWHARQCWKYQNKTTKVFNDCMCICSVLSLLSLTSLSWNVDVYEIGRRNHVAKMAPGRSHEFICNKSLFRPTLCSSLFFPFILRPLLFQFFPPSLPRRLIPHALPPPSPPSSLYSHVIRLLETIVIDWTEFTWSVSNRVQERQGVHCYRENYTFVCLASFGECLKDWWCVMCFPSNNK